MPLIISSYVQICIPLIIGLYVIDLYATNNWIACDGFVPLVMGLDVMELYATNYWIVCADLFATNYWILFDGFVCH